MVNGDRKNTNQADIQVIADPSIGENLNLCVDLPIMIINKIPISQPFIRIGTIVQIKTNTVEFYLQTHMSLLQPYKQHTQIMQQKTAKEMKESITYTANIYSQITAKYFKNGPFL